MSGYSYRSCLLAAVASSLCFISVQAAENEQVFDLAPQLLAQSLSTVAQSTRSNLIFDPTVLAGRQAPALSGRYDLDGALSVLLAGSGLEVLRTESGAYIVRPVPSTAAAIRPATWEKLEEIVVTAQKRREKLKEVPGSVSAFSGATLAANNMRQGEDYLGYVSGTTMVTTGRSGRGYIGFRGVTSVGNNINSTVAIYVDDVPVNASNAFAESGVNRLDLSPYDLERIEVLKGPQGTVYGGNSLAGILKYVTRAPDPDQASAEAGLELSDTAHSGHLGYTARVAANLPLAEDKLAARVSFQRRHTSGFIDNPDPAVGKDDFNRSEIDTARASLLWQPVDDVSLRLGVTHQQAEGSYVSVIFVNPATRQPRYGKREQQVSVPVPSNNEYTGYSATLTWDLPWAQLTSASAYTQSDYLTSIDRSPNLSDLAPYTVDEGTVSLEKFVEELRLSSPEEGRLRWLAGLFYTKEDTRNTFELRMMQTPQGPATPLSPFFRFDMPSDYEEMAAFGDLTLSVTDRLDLGVGGRISRNDQSGFQSVNGLEIDPDDVNAVSTYRGKADETVSLYSATARYKLTPSHMLYGRVATGYRPGGFNAIGSGGPESFDADTTTNYEIGAKGETADRRFGYELALYQVDWKDLQGETTANGILNYFINVGRARNRGVEFSANYELLEGLRLSATGNYLHSRLKEDIPEAGATRGEALPLAAKWSGSAALDYTTPIGGDLVLHGNLGTRYTGRSLGDFSAIRRFKEPANTLVDLNIDISGESWTAGLFVKNLTDRYVMNSISNINYFVGEPRVIGLKFDVRF